MTLDDFQVAAARTAGDQPPQYFAMGLAGEAGEYCDYLKKVIFHGKPLDRVKAAEELGDVLWYLALAAKSIGVNLETIATGNIEKLKIRYPEGFSPAASAARVDTAAAKEAHAGAVRFNKRTDLFDGCCNAVSPDRYLCTRPGAHEGQHVASDGSEVVTQW